MKLHIFPCGAAGEGFVWAPPVYRTDCTCLSNVSVILRLTGWRHVLTTRLLDQVPILLGCMQWILVTSSILAPSSNALVTSSFLLLLVRHLLLEAMHLLLVASLLLVCSGEFRIFRFGHLGLFVMLPSRSPPQDLTFDSVLFAC